MAFKTQADVLLGSGMSPDVMPEYRFEEEAMTFLAVAEGFVQNEWERVCGVVGLEVDVQEVPTEFERPLQIQGRWQLGYPAPRSL